MNIKDALNQTHQDLRNFLEAEVLLKSCLEMESSELYLNPDYYLSNYERNLLKEAIKKRKNRLPLAYIIGKKGFYSLEFRITPDTFIPRPETEFIVDAVLKRSPVTGHRLPVTDYRSLLAKERPPPEAQGIR